MDLITWQDNFNTNNNIIDNQHKNLVQLINELFNYLGEIDRSDKIHLIFDQLFNYTIEHFSEEEKLMQQFNYPGYLDHMAAHELFRSKILELKEKIWKSKYDVAREVLTFLKDWLLNHIISSDKMVFEYINNCNMKK